MKSYLRMICLALCVAFPAVSRAQGLFSNTSSREDRIIKALPGKSIAKGARGVTPAERIQNDHASFCVRVSVCLLDNQGKRRHDRDNCTFTEGECMGVEVVSAKSGYLWAVQCVQLTLSHFCSAEE